MSKNRTTQNKLIEKIEQSIDAENTLSHFYQHIASLTKNGKIRKRFRAFAESAKQNKEILSLHLEELGVRDFELENRCSFCQINPDSFSLNGALNLELEITRAATLFYKDLSNGSFNPDEKMLFRRLMREKKDQVAFIKKEKRLHEKDIEDHNSNNKDLTVPDIFSKLLDKRI